MAASQTGDDGFGVVSDGTGHFTVYTTPGAYQIVTVYPGQLANASVSPTVNSNQFVTANLTNVPTDGLPTISGQVIDSVTSNGLPGIPIQGESSSGLAVFTFAGTNGAYTVQVNADKWTLQMGGGVGTILGYDRGSVTKISTNASGAVTNVNFQLVKGNALVYGTVTTSQSNAVPTVEMQSSDTYNVTCSMAGV